MMQPDMVAADPDDTAVGTQRVLMLCHRVPYPLDRGDRIRAFHILEYLSRRFDVALACVSDEPVSNQQREVLSKLAGRVAVQRVSRPYSKLRGVAGLVVGGAITPSCFYRRRLAQTIWRWHQDQPFDAVLTYCTAMIGYARVLTRRSRNRSAQAGLSRSGSNRGGLRHVIDLVDVDSAKWLDYAGHTRRPMRWVYAAEARRLRQIEAGRLDCFDGVTVVSEAEAGVYRDQVGHHPGLTVVRHAVDLAYFTPRPQVGGKTMVFVGVLNYRPNADGIAWFVRHVMPLLRRRVPGARLQIVGRHPTPRIRALGQQSGVEVVGSVPDVRKYLERSAAVIAPLQIARGVQTKVLEAMASGRAVVCSPGAADGIEATDGRHLLVADGAQQWVEKLERVLTDPALRAQLSVMGRSQVERAYAWENCLRPLDGLLSGQPLAGCVSDDVGRSTPKAA